MSTQPEVQGLNPPAGRPDVPPVGETAHPLSQQYNAHLDQSKTGIKVIGSRAQLLDDAPPGDDSTPIGPSDPQEVITISVMVKSKASEKEMDQTIDQIASGKRAPLTDAEYTAKFGADPAAMARIENFAKDNSLTVDDADPRSGRIELKGKIQDISAAFNLMLEDYKSGDTTFRQQTAGNAFMPRAIGGDIQGIFGLNTRPIAKPLYTIMKHGDVASHADAGTPDDNDNTPMPPGFMPNQVADLYKFPKESMGAGQSVGIVEMGGGLDLKDNAQYYKEHHLKMPKIQVVGIDGAQNKAGSNADGEVALDSQIVGAVAPDANQQLIFASNGDQGFIDSITRATFPEKGEPQNSSISISWGTPEPKWNAEDLHNMHLAFKKAALRGISVFAADGDWGAHDLSADKSYSTLYPASDPLVTGVGGTELDASGSETPWNDSTSFFPSGATGGGISERFAVPDYQKGLTLPEDANGNGKIGRGVPDVAGDASKGSGYFARYGGSETVLGGTSCVAPLYAALMARVNGALAHPADGSPGRTVGFLNPFLYKHGKLGLTGAEPEIFNQITAAGDNGVYQIPATPGWNAVVGWGSIRGDQFLKQLRQDKM